MNEQVNLKSNGASCMKHVHAGLVLIAGAAAAFLFRTEPPADARTVAEGDVLVRRVAAPLDDVPSSTHLLGYVEATGVGVDARPERRTAALVVRTSVDGVRESAVMHESPSARLAAAGPPPQATMRPFADADAARDGLTSTPANAARRHRVCDGDTLGGLADRYYGDARRWHEIFEANRTALRNPEVLPIGVELTIPAFKPTATQPAAPPPARLIPRILFRNP